MFNPDLNQTPINIMPKSVVFLIILIAFVEAILQLGQKGLIGDQASIAWRMQLIQKYGFFDTIFEWMRHNSTYNFNGLIRFFTYSFIHKSTTEIIFVLVFIATFGKFIAEVFGDIAVLLIFIFSGIMGAIGFGVFSNGTFLVGGYPAVYGLIGAFTWVQFSIQRMKGETGFRAFHLIIFFMILALIYNLVYSNNSNEWIAEIIGFISGFCISIIIKISKEKFI